MSKPRSRQKRGLLLWANCALDKHGSFEDYLIRLISQASGEGWRSRICVESVGHSGVAGLIEAAGATLGTIRPGWAGRLSFVHEVLSFQPHVVHAHFGALTSSQPLFLRGLSAGKARAVVSDHTSRPIPADVPRNGCVETFRRRRRRLMALGVDLYLPVSRFVAAELTQALGPTPSKVVPLLNGVDIARFRPCRATERARLRQSLLGLPADFCLIAFVGQLRAEKEIKGLLDVQRRLLAARTDVAFLWVGEGPLAVEVAAAAGPRAIYLGQRDDVQELLRSADILVSPSVWKEAFSLVLAEGAATGLPAVAARVGGVPEVIEDGVTGLLVPPGDVAAMEAALIRLVADAALRRTMGAAARQRAERLFDLDKLVASTLMHYDTLLAVGCLARELVAGV